MRTPTRTPTETLQPRQKKHLNPKTNPTIIMAIMAIAVAVGLTIEKATRDDIPPADPVKELSNLENQGRKSPEELEEWEKSIIAKLRAANDESQKKLTKWKEEDSRKKPYDDYRATLNEISRGETDFLRSEREKSSPPPTPEIVSETAKNKFIGKLNGLELKDKNSLTQQKAQEFFKAFIELFSLDPKKYRLDLSGLKKDKPLDEKTAAELGINQVDTNPVKYIEIKYNRKLVGTLCWDMADSSWSFLGKKFSPKKDDKKIELTIFIKGDGTTEWLNIE